MSNPGTSTEQAEATPTRRVLIVTGMSGAGRSSTLKSLEDMGYETVDNIPLSLLASLVTPHQSTLPFQEGAMPLAIGVNIRTRDFEVDSFIKYWDDLLHQTNLSVTVLFLDCDDDELNRRYTETRHRHPLALDRPVIDGIRHERRLVTDLRRRADLVLDTTQLSPRELNNLLQGHFSEKDQQSLAVFVTSFSYRRGLPREADLVFDVRFLRNPHYEPDLKSLTGLDEDVAQFISGDEEFKLFFENLTRLLEQLLPRYAAEGKSYLTIAIGCTGGRHRSVFVAEQLKMWLSQQNRKIQIQHRDLNNPKK
ncbi:MAG: RNase adapter RapZ [Rhodospirillales bacterium]|jgi:RNase adapter protein RapZ